MKYTLSEGKDFFRKRAQFTGPGCANLRSDVAIKSRVFRGVPPLGGSVGRGCFA